MATLYKYQTQGGREVQWVDEEDAYKPDDIRRHWSETFPELSSAQAETKEEEQTVEVEGAEHTVGKVVTFVKKVGTKGNDQLAISNEQGDGGSAPYFRLYEDLGGGRRLWLAEDTEDMVADRAKAGLFSQRDWMFWAAECGLEREGLPEDEWLRIQGAPMLPGFGA